MACLKVDTIVKCVVAGAIKHKVSIHIRLAATSGYTLGFYQLGHSIASLITSRQIPLRVPSSFSCTTKLAIDCLAPSQSLPGDGDEGE